MAIRLEDLVEDLGFIPSLCIYASYETSRPLSSTFSDVGHVFNSYDWTQSFDQLKRTLSSILVMCFLWNIVLLIMVLIFMGIAQVYVILVASFHGD